MEYNQNEKKRNTILIVVITFIVLAIISLLLVLNNRTYTVTFNNGSESKIVEVKRNKSVDKPVTPTKKGYRFIGWYSNGVKFDFDTKITKNVDLEARFEKEVEDDDLEKIPTTTTTTVAPEETTTASSTKKNNTTSRRTKSPTTRKPEANTTTRVTTKPPTTTTTTTTTTTKAVVYGYYWVDDKNSSIGQSMLYIVNKNTNARVSGTATITYANGASETVSIPASGRMFVKSTVSQVSNVRGN